MTITNDERREVATRLREFVADCKDEACDSMHFAMYACWSDKGICEAYNTSEALNRLADLIDPEERTCRIDRRVPDAPFCSECAYDWKDDWNFCPNCGCKAIN